MTYYQEGQTLSVADVHASNREAFKHEQNSVSYY